MKRRSNGSGPSFSDLPDNILVIVLLRLSVNTIFVCKCVCKTWYDLISDPDFAKLHLNQAQVYPLLRTSGLTFLSRMLYLVQPERVDFQRMLRDDYNSPVKIKLDFELKLPLRNIEMILDKDGVDGVDVKNCIMKLNMKDHKYNIANSCNGLLCLSDPSDHNEPVIVCNPITGEFINLPEVRTNRGLPIIGCGFGFSPVTNQYKVIRLFVRMTEEIPVMFAEVHTLGTETWRVLPSLPELFYVLVPIYLNGCVYWNVGIPLYTVKSFDVEKECFESISVPWNSINYNARVSIGVLGGELFISASPSDDILRFWVMKDNGANKSWSQIFSFDEKLRYGRYQPVMYLNNGALLMFNSDVCALIYKDPSKRTGFRYLKVSGFNSQVEAIAHIPSFVPLKNALSGGHDVTVLNVNSRCAELKLYRESNGLSLRRWSM